MKVYSKVCSFAEGKPIPTELRNEEAALRREIDLEDENTASMLLLFLFYPLGKFSKIVFHAGSINLNIIKCLSFGYISHMIVNGSFILWSG